MAEWFGSATVARVIWVLAVFLAFLVVSLLVPRLLVVLAECREGLATLRRTVATWGRNLVASRWASFWRERGAEPQEPVLAALERIDAAARTLGHDQIDRLGGLQTRLEREMAVLREASVPDQVSAGAVRDHLAASISAGGVSTIVALVLLAVALGIPNATLLSLFFKEVLGTGAVLPTLLPQLQIGHVFALLFFVVEVASGWLIYRSSHRSGTAGTAGAPQPATGPELFFRGIGWFVLFALAIIETMAYAVLSDRIDLPGLLHIPPSSAFFGFTRYFFALFGCAITLGLAAIGHSLGEALASRRQANAHRRIARVIQKREADRVRSVERVRDCVKVIREVAEGMPMSVATAFADALRIHDPYPGTPLLLHAATGAAVTSTDPERAKALLAPGVAVPQPPVRTATQVTADLVLYVVAGVVLVAVGWLTTSEVMYAVAPNTRPLARGLAWAAGFGTPVALVVLGLAARNALNELRYASPVEQVLVQPRGRRIFGYLVAGLAVLGGIGLALLASAVEVVAGQSMLNATLGLVQAGVLVTLGGFLDRIVIAVVHLGYLAWLMSIRIVALIVTMSAIALEALLAIVAAVSRIAAIPGDLIRSLVVRSSRASSPQPQS